MDKQKSEMGDELTFQEKIELCRKCKFYREVSENEIHVKWYGCIKPGRYEQWKNERNGNVTDYSYLISYEGTPAPCNPKHC